MAASKPKQFSHARKDVAQRIIDDAFCSSQRKFVKPLDEAAVAKVVEETGCDPAKVQAFFAMAMPSVLLAAAETWFRDKGGTPSASDITTFAAAKGVEVVRVKAIAKQLKKKGVKLKGDEETKLFNAVMDHVMQHRTLPSCAQALSAAGLPAGAMPDAKLTGIISSVGSLANSFRSMKKACGATRNATPTNLRGT